MYKADITVNGTNYHFEKASKVVVTKLFSQEEVLTRNNADNADNGQWITQSLIGAPIIKGSWTNKGIEVPKKYGILIGRFQPFHIAHEAMIHEIIADGRIPIVIVGGFGKRDARHPLAHHQVAECIRKVFPTICIHGITDSSSWDYWFENINNILCKYPDKVVYYHNKFTDRTAFEFGGTTIIGWYTDVFRLMNILMKEVTFPSIIAKVDSSSIRKNVKGCKAFLDGRVYNYLTNELGW